MYVVGTYREKGSEGVERGGTGCVKTRKGALPFGKAPLFGVALSCVWLGFKAYRLGNIG